LELADSVKMRKEMKLIDQNESRKVSKKIKRKLVLFVVDARKNVFSSRESFCCDFH